MIWMLFHSLRRRLRTLLILCPQTKLIYQTMWELLRQTLVASKQVIQVSKQALEMKCLE